MINVNGNFQTNQELVNNRGYAYGDMLFETIKVSHGKLLFWEDHYFRLMASMRIMRMQIPMEFTMEFLEEQILETLSQNTLMQSSARVKLTVHRNTGGLYLPSDHGIGYMITASPISNDFYLLNETAYEVDLFKDFYQAPGLLSTLKSNNRAINIVGSVYAKENDLDNCLILNTDKQIVEALNGNIFLVKDKHIKTPALAAGCIKGVMRKQILQVLELMPEYTVEEGTISAFELQKADELFISNVITGIQSITKYRKKSYEHTVAKEILQKLNVKVRLGATA